MTTRPPRFNYSQRLCDITSLLLTALTLCNGCQNNPQSEAPAPPPSPFQYQPTANNTHHDGLRGETNFFLLIQNQSQGKSSHAPWAGYWWPFLENGIAQAASQFESATQNTGALQWELSHHGASASGIQSWWGHCNGWAVASVLFPEPQSEITHAGTLLSVADQKALLSELGQEVNADFFGQRADTDDPADPSFQDIFPDQFFLVLTNTVGQGQSLIMDRYTGAQIWNHPIAGYRISPLSPADDLGASPIAPNVYRIMVTTQVWWLRDDVDPATITDPFTFENGPDYDSRILRSEIWLDAPPQFNEIGTLTGSGQVILARQGEIVYGGAWREGSSDILNSHPDYLWMPNSLAPASKYANPFIQAPLVQALIMPNGPT